MKRKYKKKYSPSDATDTSWQVIYRNIEYWDIWTFCANFLVTCLKLKKMKSQQQIATNNMQEKSKFQTKARENNVLWNNVVH